MTLKFIPLLLIGFSCYACNGAENKTEEMTEETAVEATAPEQDGEGKYGAEITAENAATPGEFLAMMDGKDSLNVKVKGNITSCCTKKGCWMDLDLENGTTMKVRFKDYGFFVPLDSKGKNTIVEGTAYLKEVPVDELKHYAEDAGKSKEEIAAITAPEVQYSFIANGVIITD